MMRDDIRRALAIGPSSTMEDRTIDITTTGRNSGKLRRIEIVFYRIEDNIYLSGIPAPHRRDWLANLSAEPRFTFHLKHGVTADLPAIATVITDVAERRKLLSPLVDQFNERRGDDSEWPRAEVDQWVEGSPLARVDFIDSE
jgi:F420H(2)-dependent quinone reductase